VPYPIDVEPFGPTKHQVFDSRWDESHEAEDGLAFVGGRRRQNDAMFQKATSFGKHGELTSDILGASNRLGSRSPHSDQ